MAWLEIANFLHFLGTAFGLGGATIATIISGRASKDKELGKQLRKIMPSIVKLIWLGLILLIISGIAITLLVTWPINRQMLLVKHFLVAWIVIIGVVMGVNMKKGKNVSVLAKINLVLWYLVTLLSAFV